MSRKIGSKERALREQREAALATRERRPLSTSERSRLLNLEAVVERGLATFVEVGQALADIREATLYRETHDTWEAYCAERWGMSGRYARRLMQASSITEEIGPIGPVPTSESQVRPLSRLPPEERADAYREAVDQSNGKPTAKAVEEVVDKRLNGSRPEEPPEARVDPVAEWERAERELEVARHTIRSMSEDDAAREVATWADKYGRLEGRLRQESRTREEAERTARYAQGKLREVREALGVESDKEIIPAIRDLLR